MSLSMILNFAVVILPVSCAMLKIGPSPEWLAQRVSAAGGRSINNVVDVTNYVMYLTGLPMHALILVRFLSVMVSVTLWFGAAHEGEKLTTLDGQERTLTPDMAVISDDGGVAVGLAGVMVDSIQRLPTLQPTCFSK